MAKRERDALIMEAARCLENHDRPGWRRAQRQLSRSLTQNKLHQLVSEARKRIRQSTQLQTA